MRSTRLRPHVHESERAVSLRGNHGHRSPVRLARLSRERKRYDGRAGMQRGDVPWGRSVFVVSADGVRRVRPRVTAQQRAVSLPWCPILEGEAQTGQRSARLRHHQQTPRGGVESVRGPRPRQRAVHSRRWGEKVGQHALGGPSVTSLGVTDGGYALGFDDDSGVGVLVRDAESREVRGEVFEVHLRARRGSLHDGDGLAGGGAVVRSSDLAADAHLASPDGFFGGGDGGEAVGEGSSDDGGEVPSTVLRAVPGRRAGDARALGGGVVGVGGGAVRDRGGELVKGGERGDHALLDHLEGA